MLAGGISSANAQNGMHFDDARTFLIPMLENNVMKGHANVYLLDKISKDSNSFMIQIYDEYLRDAGEKKFTLDSKFTFNAAIFNGTNIVTKFLKKQEAIRYIVFDQKATIIFDTTLNIKLQKPSEIPNEHTFKQTPFFAVNNQVVLDYLNSISGGVNGNTIVGLTTDNKIWQYSQQSSKPENVQLLMADNKFIINSVQTYLPRNHFNDVNTAIQILSAQGAKMGEVNLYKNDSTSIYPISADIQKNGIEVISEFTTRIHELSKVKYGICIHKLDFAGNIISEHFNEITQSLAKDSLAKKYKLLVHSYLYIHKAVKLKNGDWLLAAEQLLRTRLSIHLFKNSYVVYNKKNICLLEVDDQADIVKMHVEPNKEDGVRVPKKYYRKPQNGATIANAKERLDINYFVLNDDDKNENISFVFTDYNYKTKKLSLGNLLYKNGEVKVDRFIIPTFTSYTKLGIYPARYGHVLLIKYDPLIGRFDFDNIKFNN